MKVNWQGVFPAISTQFSEDASINCEANVRMLEDLLRDGINGIIALGTVGENASLTAEEKHEFIKHRVKTVNSRLSHC